MDIFTFISSIINSIVSLPVIILIFIILFRKKIIELFDSITEIRKGDWVITIKERINGNAIVLKEVEKDISHFQGLAEKDPVAAILVAWNEFEKVSNPIVKGRFSYNKIFRDFEDEGLITDEEAKSLTESRNLRNEVTHYGINIPIEKVVQSAFSIYEISRKLDKKVSNIKPR